MPSALSALVRKLGKVAAADGEAEATMRLQRNASSAFDALVRRLDAVYARRATEAPTDFKERIDFWHSRCGMPAALHSGLQRLRVWRNASEHHDAQRWRAEGPSSEDEFMALTSATDRDVHRLEQ